ncbi:hypothetical protein SAMN03080615_00623 [Amphritea atlantica]|uniref:YgjP-like metallopeptidase domain-containing protein n=1 Tax=Amphritea atlantica TaxID=355243 RepID=A0A1H9DP51_9GAMM|nr:SprT family zinc-dependent metalloprotease [Amphritea atlantica]SEQ14488.1 hypothetical protein SAMN03080615_00623 [Amphritea atlantica]
MIPDYTLRRSSRRRTIEIQVRPDSVRVLAPIRVAQSRINQLVAEKSDWIATRQQELRLRLPISPQPVVLEQGSELRWLGEPVMLKLATEKPETAVNLSAGIIELSLSRRIRKPQAEVVPEQLERWYREQAQHYFQQRVAEWSELMKLSPTAIVVRSYKRKWGCCNSRGVVSFNWLLMMAPVRIIDYVIVHELSHLKQMNHSPRFWQEVNRFYPDYAEAKAWLNSHGAGLCWPPVGARPDRL